MADWLNKDYIEKTLRKSHEDDTLVVVEYKLSPVVPKGDNSDNYMSDIIRASCQILKKGKEEKISLVIKIIPSTPLAEMIKNLNCFETEIQMLRDVVPAFQEILSAVGEDMALAPKLYYSENAPNPILIMEDLSQDGYGTGDRCDGLNLSQSLLVMKSLATFHVASLVLLNQRPELKQDLKEGYWGTANTENTKVMYTDGLQKVVDNIDSWSDEKWAEQLKPLQKGVLEVMHAAFDEFTPGVPKVVSHGDLWTNNIMFKTLGDNQYDLRFIDLQLSSVRSPVIDILYFIFSSPTTEIRIRELDTMLKTYHERWTQVCELLGEPNDFTYESLLKEFKKKLIFGFAILYSVRAVVSLPKGVTLELSDELDQLEMKLYNNKHLQEAVLSALPYFKSQGLF